MIGSGIWFENFFSFESGIIITTLTSLDLNMATAELIKFLRTAAVKSGDE